MRVILVYSDCLLGARYRRSNMAGFYILEQVSSDMEESDSLNSYSCSDSSSPSSAPSLSSVDPSLSSVDPSLSSVGDRPSTSGCSSNIPYTMWYCLGKEETARQCLGKEVTARQRLGKGKTARQRLGTEELAGQCLRTLDSMVSPATGHKLTTLTVLRDVVQLVSRIKAVVGKPSQKTFMVAEDQMKASKEANGIDETSSHVYNQLNYVHNIKKYLLSQQDSTDIVSPSSCSLPETTETTMETTEVTSSPLDNIPVKVTFPGDIKITNSSSDGSSTVVYAPDFVQDPSLSLRPPLEPLDDPGARHPVWTVHLGGIPGPARVELTEEALRKHTKLQEELLLLQAKKEEEESEKKEEESEKKDELGVWNEEVEDHVTRLSSGISSRHNKLVESAAELESEHSADGNTETVSNDTCSTPFILPIMVIPPGFMLPVEMSMMHHVDSDFQPMGRQQKIPMFIQQVEVDSDVASRHQVEPHLPTGFEGPQSSKFESHPSWQWPFFHKTDDSSKVRPMGGFQRIFPELIHPFPIPGTNTDVSVPITPPSMSDSMGPSSLAGDNTMGITVEIPRDSRQGTNSSPTIIPWTHRLNAWGQLPNQGLQNELKDSQHALKAWLQRSIVTEQRKEVQASALKGDSIMDNDFVFLISDVNMCDNDIVSRVHNSAYHHHDNQKSKTMNSRKRRTSTPMDVFAGTKPDIEDVYRLWREEANLDDEMLTSVPKDTVRGCKKLPKVCVKKLCTIDTRQFLEGQT